MAEKGMKMIRQLLLYDRVLDVSICILGPTELMKSFGISRRMLQRDLKDFRDSGLINVKYDKSQDRYVLSEKEAKFDESAGIRRQQHLKRLFRLGTLIGELTRTPLSEIESYEQGVKEFNEYVEDSMENPEEFPPEDIEMMREFYIPKELELPDLKAEYRSLFPDSSDRTRQRDFKELINAGFLEYNYDYETYIFIYDDVNIDEEEWKL